MHRSAGSLKSCSSSVLFLLALVLARSAYPEARDLFPAGFLLSDAYKTSELLLADVDLDGHLDAVGVGLDRPWMGSIAVTWGNGDGTFEGGFLPGGALAVLPSSPFVADFNADGRRDLAHAIGWDYEAPPDVLVYLARSDGGFDPPRPAYLPEPFRLRAATDLTGDGRGDFLYGDGYTRQDTDSIVVAVASSAGFGFGTRVVIRKDAYWAQVTDFDGDGTPDIVTLDDYNLEPWRTLSVFRANSGGDFPLIASAQLWVDGEIVAMRDFDHDGWLDLVLEYVDQVRIVFGSATGVYDRFTEYRVGGILGPVAVGDLDADSHLDIAVLSCSGGAADLFVLVGDGSGGVARAVRAPRAGLCGLPIGMAASLAIGDVDEDGLDDLVVPGFTWLPVGGLVSVLPSRGPGLSALHYEFDASFGASSIAAGDLNSDGFADLVTSSLERPNRLGPPEPGYSIQVLLGSGDGRFRTLEECGVGRRPWNTAIGDLNLDGHPDVVAAGSSEVHILTGNGDGSFTRAAQLPVGGRVGLGDVDADGYLDVVVGEGAKIHVYYGNSTGTFPTLSTLSSATPFSRFAVSDLNGDGRSDAVLLEASGVAVALSVNGKLEWGPRYFFLSPASSLTIGRVDADAHPDLVAGRTILIGVGDGSFVPAPPSWTPPLSADFRECALGDFDGDGRTDLVAAGTCGSSCDGVSVLLATGDGYADPVNFETGRDARAVVVEDFDRDGRNDLAVANYMAASVTILLNRGATPTSVEDGHDRPGSRLFLEARYDLGGGDPVRVRFRIGASSAPAALSVFDVRGGLVRSLVRGPVAPGEHSTAWNRRDESGRQVPSGVYFLALASGRERAVKKCVLLRR